MSIQVAACGAGVAAATRNFSIDMTDLIQPYNPAWKAGFEQLKEALSAALGGLQVDIQHVGSTAIPGLHAKPVLDMDIILRRTDDLDGVAARLEALGYESRGEQGIAGRFAFRQRSAATPDTGVRRDWHAHHLYVCYPDALALRNHLLFRDALLADPALAAQYAGLKLALVQEQGMTRDDYARRKTAFILSVLAGAGMDAEELESIRRAND